MKKFMTDTCNSMLHGHKGRRSSKKVAAEKEAKRNVADKFDGPDDEE